MGPLSRLAAVLLLFAALPLAAVERPQLSAEERTQLEAAEAPVLFDTFERSILQERSPHMAQFLLAAGNVHAKMKAADPARFEKLFASAAELADVERVLVEHARPEGLREALNARHGFDLLEDTPAFLAWTKSMDWLDQKKIRSAMLEWDTLDKDLSVALAAQGKKPADWAKLSIHARTAALSEVSAKALEEFLATVPKTYDDMKAFYARAKKLAPLLSGDDVSTMWDYFNRADSAVKGLAEARALAGKNPSPEVKAALDAALKAGSLDGMLTKLGLVFDGVRARGGAVNDETAAAVRRAGPGSADQRFTPEQRATYTEMLRHALLDEMKGTVAGDTLREFYKKEPFNLIVQPMAHGVMGLYQSQTNQVSVSEDIILRYVREKGRSTADLLTDKALFRDVSRAVLSTVVHEGIHQEQESWRRANSLPEWYVVEHEVEAKSREAAFVLEKASKDPGYAKFMADPENQEKLVFVREASLIANELNRDPVTFRERIRTVYYPGVVSIETQARWAAQDPAFLREVERGIAAELARREKMTPAERQAFDARTVPEADRLVHSPAEGVALISTFKTDALKERVRALAQHVAQSDARRRSAASDYAAYVSRDTRTGVEVGGILAMVNLGAVNGPALGGSGGGGGPPPPPATRLTVQPPPPKPKKDVTEPRRAEPRGSTLPFIPPGHENCQDPTHGHPRTEWR